MPSFSAWALTGLALAAVGLPGLVEAGPIGWSTMAEGASTSMRGFAHSSIPLVVGAGLMSAAWHLPGMTTGLIATGGAMFGAANSDQVQTLIGGGAGGGLITDVIVSAAPLLSLGGVA